MKLVEPMLRLVARLVAPKEVAETALGCPCATKALAAENARRANRLLTSITGSPPTQQEQDEWKEYNGRV